MNENGCYGCKDRVLGCHSTCEKYIKWKKVIDKNNIARRKALKKESDGKYHK